LKQIELFLEDQHPLVRANLRLGLSLFSAIVALHVLIYIGVRVLKPRFMFEVNTWLRLLTTLVVLMLIILGYNALKITVQFVRRRGVFTWRSLLLAYLAVAALGFSLLNMPDVFDRAVAASVGRSYNNIHSEFREVCSRWDEEWMDEDAVTMDIDAQDVGSLREVAEVYRVSNTVYFDFGDEDYAFGFACVLRAAAPSETGRARDYTYSRIRGAEYQFITVTR
jgi:hypothetical protein